MSARKRPPKEEPPTSAADAAERLARIVDAAERAAASVIDDAEKQAQDHLEEARSRADRVIAERLRELADELDPEGPEERPTKAHLKAVKAAPEPDEPAPDHSPDAAGARLLATQMAVSGAGRDEIEKRLRKGFEIEDPSGILDAILGPEE
jgi:vacuolar-type H+-ATPase subunit H